jgi:hypothetical protein
MIVIHKTNVVRLTCHIKMENILIQSSTESKQDNTNHDVFEDVTTNSII